MPAIGKLGKPPVTATVIQEAIAVALISRILKAVAMVFNWRAQRVTNALSRGGSMARVTKALIEC